MNNNDKPHTIGCKVDGRLCIVDKAHIDDIDICHFETARSTKNNKKIRDDKAKLAIETKCLIDNVFLQEEKIGQFKICNFVVPKVKYVLWH